MNLTLGQYLEENEEHSLIVCKTSSSYDRTISNQWTAYINVSNAGYNPRPRVFMDRGTVEPIYAIGHGEDPCNAVADLTLLIAKHYEFKHDE